MRSSGQGQAGEVRGRWVARQPMLLRVGACKHTTARRSTALVLVFSVLLGLATSGCNLTKRGIEGVESHHLQKGAVYCARLGNGERVVLVVQFPSTIDLANIATSDGHPSGDVSAFAGTTRVLFSDPPLKGTPWSYRWMFSNNAQRVRVDEVEVPLDRGQMAVATFDGTLAPVVKSVKFSEIELSKAIETCGGGLAATEVLRPTAK